MSAYMSEKMLNKATKLYGLITEEIKRLEGYCRDVLNAAYGLKNCLVMIEEQTQGKTSYHYFNNAVKSLEDNLEEIDRLKYFLIGKMHKYLQDLNNGSFVEGDLTESEVEELKQCTGKFIELLNEALSTLKPIQTETTRIKEESKLHFKVEDLYGEEINSINNRIYEASNKVQMVISHIGERISQSIKKGSLHELIVSDSLLKADIELLKNNKNKR